MFMLSFKQQSQAKIVRAVLSDIRKYENTIMKSRIEDATNIQGRLQYSIFS